MAHHWADVFDAGPMMSHRAAIVDLDHPVPVTHCNLTKGALQLTRQPLKLIIESLISPAELI